MNYNIGLILLGIKGLKVLKECFNIDPKKIKIVIIGIDKNVHNDYSQEIANFCDINNIQYQITNYAKKPIENYQLNWWIVVGWRWLLPVKENIIILHDSILPKYRGFSPLVNMLINGEKNLGVTALKISENYDEGEIIKQNSVPIKYPIKIKKAIEIVSDLYTLTIKQIINSFGLNNEIKSYPQNHKKATYSLWRNEDDYFLNFHNDAERIERSVNALGFPFQSAKCRIEDNVYFVKEVEVLQDQVIEDRLCSIGKVIKIVNGQPVVVCGQGLLLIKEIHDENGQSLIPLKKFRIKFS